MLSALVGATLAFFVTFYSIPVILVVSRMKNLNDMPDFRKVHRLPVSPLGGIGIFCGFIVGFLLSDNLSELAGHPALQYIFLAFLIAFFLGVKDDILILSPLKKFVGQLAIAAILVFKGRFLITSFNGIFGSGELSPVFSELVSLIFILAIINAYNLIDGLDGLAGTLGAIAAVFFAAMLWLSGDIFYALLGFSFAGSLLGFLRYNFSPARIFMGDVGSMLIGIVIAILSIRFMSHQDPKQRYPIIGSPALTLAPMIVPVLDMLRLFFLRLLKRKSPFKADCDHLHHLLYSGRTSQRQVVIFLSMVTLAFTVASYSLLHLGAYLVISLQVIIFYPITVIFQILSKSNFRLFRSRSFEPKGPSLVTLLSHPEIATDTGNVSVQALKPFAEPEEEAIEQHLPT